METNDDAFHSFMVLTHETGTMILQTGEEINEIENTGFSTNLPTIFVGNVGNNRYIVQVTTKHLRLLQGKTLNQVKNNVCFNTFFLIYSRYTFDTNCSIRCWLSYYSRFFS